MPIASESLVDQLFEFHSTIASLTGNYTTHGNQDESDALISATLRAELRSNAPASWWRHGIQLFMYYAAISYKGRQCQFKAPMERGNGAQQDFKLQSISLEKKKHLYNSLFWKSPHRFKNLIQ